MKFIKTNQNAVCEFGLHNETILRLSLVQQTNPQSTGGQGSYSITSVLQNKIEVHRLPGFEFAVEVYSPQMHTQNIMDPTD